MALNLPYPALTFVPLDVLTAEEMNQIVSNYTYISNQFPVATANIADNAISTAKLAGNAVTTAKVADKAVTSAKVDWSSVATSYTSGDSSVICYGDGTMVFSTIVSASLTFTQTAGVYGAPLMTDILFKVGNSPDFTSIPVINVSAFSTDRTTCWVGSNNLTPTAEKIPADTISVFRGNASSGARSIKFHITAIGRWK